MSSVLGGDGRESLTTAVRVAVRESVKDALVEALEEVEAERARRSRGRRLFGALTFLGIGTVLGYALRQRRIPAEAAETVAERARETSEEVTDTGRSQRGRSPLRRIVMGGVAVGVAYGLRRWLGSRDRTPPISERTEAAADRTESVADEAADRIEAGGQRAADRVEDAGETAEDVREQTKEAVEERDEDGG